MKTATLFLLSIVGWPATAQTTAIATEVRGHRMGESVPEFFAKAGKPELLDICAGGDKKEIRRISRDVCKGALAARSGARAFTTDPKWSRTDRAILSEGKLVAVEFSFVDPFEEVVSDLVKRYGAAANTESRVSQNGYGATWNVGTASWLMPDGTEIAARERISFGGSVGYFRVTDVTFRSKDEIAHLNAVEKKRPNAFE